MKIKSFQLNNKGKIFYIIIAIVLIIISVIGSTFTIQFGYKGGLISLISIFGILFVYAVLRLPRFGVIALLVMSYFIMFVVTFASTEFPLGTVMDGMLALLILGFFIQQKYYKNFAVFNNPISYLILIWILYNLIQVFNPNAASQLAWIYTIRSVAIIMLSYYIFTYYIISKEFIKTVIKLWLGLSIFAALYAIKQEYFGFFAFEEVNHYDPLVQSLLFIDGHWRKSSIFSDPVAFSYNMVVSSLLCLGLLTGPLKIWRKVTLIGLVILFLTVMLYSGTRAAYVLVPAAGLIFLILKLNRNLFLLAIIGALGLFTLINLPTGSITLYRFQSAFKPSDDASYNVRIANQKRIQPYIQTHPIGGGLGGTGIWGKRFAPNSFLAQIPPDSGYLRVGMELGWIGLFILCTIMFTALYLGVKNYFNMRDPELKSYCFAMVLIVFAIVIANFPQEAIVQFPLNVFFYLFLALIHVTKVLDDKQYKEEQALKEKEIKIIE